MKWEIAFLRYLLTFLKLVAQSREEGWGLEEPGHKKGQPVEEAAAGRGGAAWGSSKGEGRWEAS